MKKSYRRQRLRTNSPDARTSQLQHPSACVNAVDVNLRMRSQEFAKEAAITFSYDQRPFWRRNLFDPISAGVL